MKTKPTSTRPPPTSPPLSAHRPPSVTDLRAATETLAAWRATADMRKASLAATHAARRMRRITRPKR
jgi:hypothetical protein